MTTKADYTENEWEQIRTAPAAVGMYIVAADPRGFDMFKEMIATASAVRKHQPDAPAQELVAAILADMPEASPARAESEQVEESSGTTPTTEVNESDLSKEAILSKVLEAVSVVETKAVPAEATAFKAWLVEIADSVANAAKEGGFLGFGGQRVTEKEKAALAELKQALKL
jgi:hypothetical protein